MTTAYVPAAAGWRVAHYRDGAEFALWTVPIVAWAIIGLPPCPCR